MKSGWFIFNKNRVYLVVSFKTEKAAREEMRAMLEPYPQGHEWRDRLSVRFVKAASTQNVGEAPYGWQSCPDEEHGVHQVRHEHEYKVLRLVAKLRKGGWSSKEIARSLNGRGLLPRHGTEWTAELVEGLEPT